MLSCCCSVWQELLFGTYELGWEELGEPLIKWRERQVGRCCGQRETLSSCWVC